MKKLAALVPALAAVAVAALLVPHQAQANTDPRRPSTSAGPGSVHAPHPTPTPTTSHPTGGHTAPPGTGPSGPNGLGGTHLPHCGTAQLLVDGGFEQPRLPAGTDHKLYAQATVPGWRTDDPHGVVELWNGARMGVPAVDGKQLAEINATGSLFQDLRTVPGSVLTWTVAIRARNATAGAPDVDTTQVHFGASPRQGQGGALGTTGAFAYRNSADDTHWKTLYGTYEVPTDQTWTRFSLTSIAHTGPAGYGNLVDKAGVTGMHC
jgi:hypothetical protein